MAYALLTAESPYEHDCDDETRSQGCFAYDERVFQGATPTPAFFIQNCMKVLPDERNDPVALADKLWL